MTKNPYLLDVCAALKVDLVLVLEVGELGVGHLHLALLELVHLVLLNELVDLVGGLSERGRADLTLRDAHRQAREIRKQG